MQAPTLLTGTRQALSAGLRPASGQPDAAQAVPLIVRPMMPEGTAQRSHGEAHVALAAGAGGARLAGLRQAGSAKAILPRVAGPPEVVFLNTSGGLTGGDRLRYGVELAVGLRATATTQTAERAYRSAGGVARVDVTHHVGAGGHLDWLPQETILFDGCALSRRTRIILDGPEASCLMLEAVVLGRAAMGETVRELLLRDRREIWRGDRPVLVEPLMLNAAALQAGAAVLPEGARAFASLALVAPGAEDALAPMRAALDEPGVAGGASGFDGKLTLRLIAADGWPLRRQILRLLQILRRAPAPRVWQI